MLTLPRLVIAAAGSGHGKTTVSVGLMAALRRRGHIVSGHKVGPDYIDPGYHALATGRPGRNLDPYLVGEERILPLLLHGSEGADIAIIEGVMGLYDGRLGDQGFASTAHVASLTQSPVLLVVDVSHTSRSVAAVAHGMRSFDSSIQIAGVVVNKAGSPRHAREAIDALAEIGMTVVGVLHRDDHVAMPSRHLGLIPAAERPEAAAALDLLAQRIEAALDLDLVVQLAGQAPVLDAHPWVAPTYEGDGDRPVVAVAAGRAFTFRYPETDELLRAAGCEVVEFDPMTADTLPPGTSALYLGGGFPETYAADLSGNRRLRAVVQDAVLSGMPTVAECAGLLYLCRSLDGRPMTGVIDADAVMTPRLVLGYRSALGSASTEVRGHEFHRTSVTPAAGTDPAYVIDGVPEGFGSPTLSASYLHVHWAGHPEIAMRLADAARAFMESGPLPADGPAVQSSPSVSTPVDEPLRHHGDKELDAGLLDFAVNVHHDGPPDWLRDALLSSMREVSSYPDPAAAELAIAGRHSRHVEEVLATAGGAEAFSLVARMRAWARPVVIQPQFTEPVVALAAAGRAPTSIFARPDDDFALPVDAIPEDADLVIVGNPTNPTGALHPRSAILGLLRPGRVVVVDEAFMDTVVGEPETLADTHRPGLLVLRSLTKLWGIPGVRSGYVVGDRGVIAELRRQQPPWSVSSAAAAAIVATSTPRAIDVARSRAAAIDVDRAAFTCALDALQIEHVPGVGPFVLLRVTPGTHARLRAAGVAVRRCDTFPGLDDSWVRVAVRPPPTARPLVDALGAPGIQGAP